MRKSIPCLCS